MQKKIRAKVTMQGVDYLLIVSGAQGRHDQSLCFSSSE